MQIRHHSDRQLVIRHRPWKTWLTCVIFLLWGGLLLSGLHPEQQAEMEWFSWLLFGASGVGFIWRGSILIYDFNQDRGSLRIVRLQPIGKRLTHHSLGHLSEVELKQCRYRGRYWYRIRLVWNSGKFHRLNTDGWNNEGEVRSIARTIADFVGVPCTFTAAQGWLF